MNTNNKQRDPRFEAALAVVVQQTVERWERLLDEYESERDTLQWRNVVGPKLSKRERARLALLERHCETLADKLNRHHASSGQWACEDATCKEAGK